MFNKKEGCCEEISTIFCTNCDSFQCENCSKVLHSFQKTKHHKKITIEEWKLSNEFNLTKNEKKEISFEQEKKEEKTKELSCEMCLTRKAVIECIHCQILYCEEDCEKAHSLPSTKNHNWFKFEIKQGEEEKEIEKIQKYCNFHPMERYKMFCSTCNTLVCILCVTDEHFGHKCLQLNSTSEKIYSELSIQYEELKERNLKYNEQLNHLEERLKSIFEQKIRMKKSIKNEILKLHQSLEKKEEYFLKSIDESKEEDLIIEEYNLFKEFCEKSDELLKKSENIFSLNHSSFMFILEGLNLTRKLEDLISNKLILKKTKENLDKVLDIKDEMKIINQMYLDEPFDFQNSFISSKKLFKGEIEEGIEFILNIFNKKGEPASKQFLDIFEFSIDIISKPTENTIAIIEKKVIENGKIYVHLKGDHLGEYNLRVHMFENEIKGSSLVAEIIPEKRFDLIRGETVTDEWTWSHEGIEPDAIMFKVNKSIQLCGIGIYTGIGKHNVLLELLKNDQIDSKIISKKYSFTIKKSNVVQNLDFDHPILIDENINFTIKVLIEGENTFQHIEDGFNSFKHEETGVEFEFSKSQLDENGTDVSMGQIPVIYFK
eukprot:gene302-6716_t